MFGNLFKRKKRNRVFTVLKGSVLVPEEELEQTRSIRVPVRCLDGNVVMTDKQIPVAVCKAIESISYRLLADYESFIDVSYQPRKRLGKVKVTALIGAMRMTDDTRQEKQQN